MFDPNSRYYNLETAVLQAPDGRELVYKLRRFCHSAMRCRSSSRSP